jgi:hypothetical protein
MSVQFTTQLPHASQQPVLAPAKLIFSALLTNCLKICIESMESLKNAKLSVGWVAKLERMGNEFGEDGKTNSKGTERKAKLVARPHLEGEFTFK